MVHNLKILFIVYFWIHAINLGILPLDNAYAIVECYVSEIEEDSHVTYDHDKDEKINTLYKITGGSKYHLVYYVNSLSHSTTLEQNINYSVVEDVPFYINQYRKNLLRSIYLPKLYVLYHCPKDYLA